jgi:hypothetical protein
MARKIKEMSFVAQSGRGAVEVSSEEMSHRIINP